MFHNEWSPEAVKPLQHTTGTETKLQFGMVWGTGRIRSKRRQLTLVPLVMASASILLAQFATNCIPGSPPVQKARRPESKVWKEPEAP